MILHGHWQGRHDRTEPVVVWLHGLLGSAREWQPVQHLMRHQAHLSIDLPGHGGSQGQRGMGFEAFSTALTCTLRYHRVSRYWLVGYSLGGRLALYHACRHPEAGLAGVVVEGAHFGLACPRQRQQRLEQDDHWARRFREQPLMQTLQHWYQQPIFADLSPTRRAAWVAARRDNHREAVAAQLSATSLGRQPWLLSELSQLAFPLHYFCGERDSKFRQLSEAASLRCALISGAGHNAHLEQPATFASLLTTRLTSQELP